MKEKLIKLLGGYTSDEVRRMCTKSFDTGALDSMLTMQCYMRDCNGEEADTWCDLMWKFVCARIDRLKKNRK
jgi:hypothetical protein